MHGRQGSNNCWLDFAFIIDWRFEGSFFEGWYHKASFVDTFDRHKLWNDAHMKRCKRPSNIFSFFPQERYRWWYYPILLSIAPSFQRLLSKRWNRRRGWLKNWKTKQNMIYLEYRVACYKDLYQAKWEVSMSPPGIHASWIVTTHNLTSFEMVTMWKTTHI